MENFDFTKVSIPTGPEDTGLMVLRLEMENVLPLVEAIFFGTGIRVDAADVDWTFYIVLDMRNTNAPRFLLQGSHDKFPLYEVYIGEQFIYGYDGLINGFGGLDLLRFGTDIRNLPKGTGPTSGRLFDLREQP